MNETNSVQTITDEISFFILYSSLIIDQSDFVSDKFSHEFFVKNLYLASGLRKKSFRIKFQFKNDIARHLSSLFDNTGNTAPQ